MAQHCETKRINQIKFLSARNWLLVTAQFSSPRPRFRIKAERERERELGLISSLVPPLKTFFPLSIGRIEYLEGCNGGVMGNETRPIPASNAYYLCSNRHINMRLYSNFYLVRYRTVKDVIGYSVSLLKCNAFKAKNRHT